MAYFNPKYTLDVLFAGMPLEVVYEQARSQMKRKQLSDFQVDVFACPLILEQCGSYFATLSLGPKFFYVSGIDERMGESEEGPAIIAGMKNREMRYHRAFFEYLRYWPYKLPVARLALFEEFAQWSELSGGFEIW